MSRSGRSVPFDIQRKIVAYSTQRSWCNVPHVSYLYDPDVTEFYEEFLRYRRRRQAANPAAPKLTWNAVILKVVAEGMRAAPALNARLTYSAFFQTGTVRRLREVDIAVPRMTEQGGMITLVLRDVGAMSLEEIARGLADLSARLANTDVRQLLARVAVRDTLDRARRLDPVVLQRVISLLLGRNRFRDRCGRRTTRAPRGAGGNRLHEEDVMSGNIVVSNIGSWTRASAVPSPCSISSSPMSSR